MADKSNRDDLVYVPQNIVEFATNRFVDVPVILQYKDVPLIKTMRLVNASYTAAFNIFDQDGMQLAVVKGTQMYLTDEGKKANLVHRYLEDGTAAELNGQTLYELRRTNAAALKAEAELFSPTGQFVRCHSSIEVSSVIEPKPFQLGGLTMSNNIIAGAKIGILVDEGSVSIAANSYVPRKDAES